MPPINVYHCDQCDFELPNGWGGVMYVQAEVCPFCDATVKRSNDYCTGCGKPVAEIDADEYRRVTCQHPGEAAQVRAVLGDDVSEAVREARTGFNSNCVCVDCLAQFELDVERDERECPECESAAVHTAEELVDEPCPNCEAGTFRKEPTGAIA